MATAEQIGTRAPKLGNLVKDELWAQHGYCRKVVTAQEATATTYEVGTVLGEITASGKYIISDRRVRKCSTRCCISSRWGQ